LETPIFSLERKYALTKIWGSPMNKEGLQGEYLGLQKKGDFNSTPMMMISSQTPHIVGLYNTEYEIVY